MTECELLLGWLNGQRKLTTSETLMLCGKGFLRLRTEDTVTVFTDKGNDEIKRPRRRFRPKGGSATGGEILTAVKGGVIAFNRELSSQLARQGLVTESPVTQTVEITTMGKALIHKNYPNLREIRNIHGSEIHY